MDKLRDYLISRIEISDTGCWEWQLSLGSHGYGNAFWNGKVETAHRLSWLAYYDEPKPNSHIHHTCRNRPCINPNHLEELSSSDHPREHFTKYKDLLCDKGHQGKRMPAGRFYCPTCAKERRPKKERELATHCKRGHEFTPENTQIPPSGRRHCRKCKQIRKKQYRQKPPST